MTAIQTQNLTKSYRKKRAVDGVTLSIEQGETFGLLGVNGAGKTTTIKMLSCLLPPSEGGAQLMGHSILHAPQKVKELLAVSPQESAIAPNLTIRENLILMCGIYGDTRTECAKKADAMLSEFGMEDIARQKARTLSGGWQRRLSIAMALITCPSILFLDEPTLGLDVLARRELWQMIAQRKGSVTIVLTTHYLEEAQALCDRIGIMAKGRLVACGSVGELLAMTEKTSLEDAFVTLCEGGGAK